MRSIHSLDPDRSRSRPDRILVVDDEPDIRDSIDTLLMEEMDDVTVLTAGTGDRALEVLREEPLDVVIVDYKLPNVDGLELLARTHEQALRLDQGLQPEMGRILITAYADLDVAVEAINEGHIDKFIQKPFDPDEILDAVRETLHRRNGRELKRID